MASSFVVRLTESSGEIHELRGCLIWRASLDGKLLGKGHAQQCVDLEEIGKMEVECRGLGCSVWRHPEIPQATPPTCDTLREASADLLATCEMVLEHMQAEEPDAPAAHEHERTLMDAMAKAEGS